MLGTEFKMEKEFEELTNKLENMHTLVQSNDLSNENVNKIYNYSTELQIHNERLSQMLAELPIVEFSAPQVLELCNTDNKVELVAIDQESVLNQNFLIHFLSFIDISDLLMTIKYILMKKINGIVAVSIQLIFFISIYLLLYDSMIGSLLTVNILKQLPIVYHTYYLYKTW